jgi:hypothetical protein
VGFDRSIDHGLEAKIAKPLVPKAVCRKQGRQHLEAVTCEILTEGAKVRWASPSTVEEEHRAHTPIAAELERAVLRGDAPVGFGAVPEANDLGKGRGHGIKIGLRWAVRTKKGAESPAPFE